MLEICNVFTGILNENCLAHSSNIIITPTNKYNILDIINAFGVLLAAIAAILSSLLIKIESKNNKTHNQLSVKPYLTEYRTLTLEENTLDSFFVFKIKNTGLGPAIIKNFSYKLDDTEILNNEKTYENVSDHMLDKIKQQLQINLENDKISPFYPSNGVVLPPNEELIIFKIIGHKTNEEGKTWADKITTNYSYSDIYGNVFFNYSMSI